MDINEIRELMHLPEYYMCKYQKEVYLWKSVDTVFILSDYLNKEEVVGISQEYFEKYH